MGTNVSFLRNVFDECVLFGCLQTFRFSETSLMNVPGLDGYKRFVSPKRL